MMKTTQKNPILMIPGRMYEVKPVKRPQGDRGEEKEKKDRRYIFKGYTRHVAIFEHIKGYKETFQITDIANNKLKIAEIKGNGAKR